MKRLRTLFICALLFCHFLGSAQSGPAGVLTPAENRFWFSSSFEKYFHLNDVPVFTNYGGNNENATATAYQEPKFNNAQASLINGYPSLKFDGVNDRFSIQNNSDLTSVEHSKRTYFFAFKTGNDVASTQVIYDEGNASRGLNVFIHNNSIYVGFYNLPNDGVGAPWGFYSANSSISPNTLYVVSFRFEGKNGTNGSIEVDLNGTTIGTISNVGLLYAHVGLVGICAAQGNTYTQSGSSGGNAWAFSGEFLEMIYYNQLINDAQYMLILNYLSSKFDIALDSAYDLYVQDEPSAGNYDHDMAGIARINGSIINDDSQGTGMVRISDPSNFNNDEFLLWGHDNGTAETTEIHDIPAGVIARFERVWRVNEVDDNHNAVNVGHIDMRWDLSELSAINASDLVLLVDSDNDGFFDDETAISGAVDVGNNNFVFNNLNAITNNVRFTIGIISNMLLPVEFVDVNARAYSITTAQVNWTTASETNNDYFSVQRSVDLVTWKSLGQVQGNGTTTASNSYSFIDFSPEPGIAYYRIKQFDYNGQHDYSEVVSLEFAPLPSAIRIYPNPAIDIVNLTIDSDQFDLEGLQFINMLGQDCRSLLQFITLDDQRITINVSNCAPGQYYFGINDQLHKLIVHD